MAGYSGTPLAKKPGRVQFSRSLGAETDIIHIFTTENVMKQALN